MRRCNWRLGAQTCKWSYRGEGKEANARAYGLAQKVCEDAYAGGPSAYLYKKSRPPAFAPS